MDEEIKGYENRPMLIPLASTSGTFHHLAVVLFPFALTAVLHRNTGHISWLVMFALYFALTLWSTYYDRCRSYWEGVKDAHLSVADHLDDRDVDKLDAWLRNDEEGNDDK